MKDRVDALISILFDKTSREDEKGDAIMYLGDLHSSKALIALIKFASNSNEPDDILDDCGESIGRICIALGKFDENIFDNLSLIAKKTALSYIYKHNPKLLSSEILKKIKNPSCHLKGDERKGKSCQ